MRTLRWLAMPIAFAIVLLFALSIVNAQDDARAGNAEVGKKLFVKIGCYECHGLQGHGSSEGPAIGPNPPSFEGFTAQLRTPANAMPPYTEKVASAQDLADLYAYLKSVPRPPSPKDIPLLK
jgi:mono/diheme cytochrome c family protein